MNKLIQIMFSFVDIEGTIIFAMYNKLGKEQTQCLQYAKFNLISGPQSSSAALEEAGGWTRI